MFFTGTSRVNEKNHLEIGEIDTIDLVNKFGTPLYVLDEAEIRNRMREYVKTFEGFNIPFQVAYASKALCTMAMCRIVESEGLSLEVVSGGELYTALKSGFPVERIHFHGNNKSYDEIEMAVKADIGAFVIDNLYEIDLINEIAEKNDKKVNALIRVTPGIEAHTHEYIQTGQEDSKFGFNIDEPIINAIQLVDRSPWINLMGIHFHIGSQIFDMIGFEKAIERVANLYEKVELELNIKLPIINTGGGFGIRYTEEDDPLSIKEYVTILVEALQYNFSQKGIKIPEVWIEPGRSIVGEAGTTLYKIGSAKEIENIRKYISIDGGMMDNPRPALYQARYQAVVANRMDTENKKTEIVTVAGKACESGDIIIKDVELNNPQSGDILAVFSTGAYNYSMASNYNRVGRPAMVLVNNGEADLVIQRESYENLIRHDVIPERLNKVNLSTL